MGSVQYFGLEWSSLFKRCKRVEDNLAKFWFCLETSELLSAQLLAGLLSDMESLSEELIGHSEALRKLNSNDDNVSEFEEKYEYIRTDSEILSDRFSSNCLSRKVEVAQQKIFRLFQNLRKKK